MHLSALLSNYFSYRSLDRHDSRANYITKVYTSTRPSLNMVVPSRKRITYGQIETPLYDRLQPSTLFYYKSHTAVDIFFIHHCGSATPTAHYNRVLDGGRYIFISTTL